MPRRPEARFDLTADDKTRRTLERVDKRLGNLGRSAAFATRAVAGIASVAALKATLLMADRFTQLNQRIRASTKDTNDFLGVQKALTEVAQETGAAFEDTVSTFQALARIREDIGASNQDFIALTKTIQQLGVIGGASGQAMSDGLRQFNQGLAAGVFRAEEFNSIVENMPELAARLAKGMGKTQGELRQMVVDGELLSRDVFENLLGQSEAINAEFQEIPDSIRRAGESVETSIGQAIARINKSLGLTVTLAKALGGVADFVTDITSSNAAEFIDDIKTKNEELEKVQERIAIVTERMNNASEAARENMASQLEGIQEEAHGIEAIITALEARLAAAKAAERVSGVPGGGGGGGSGETDAEEKKRERAIASAEKLFAELEVLKLRELGDEEALDKVRFDRKQAELDAELERLRENGALTAEIRAGLDQAQEDLDIARNERKLEREREFLEQERDLMLEFEEARVEAEEEANEEILAKRRKVFAELGIQVEKLQELEDSSAKEKTQFAIGQAIALTQGLAQTSKAAFKVNKALAIGDAIMNTAAAVTSALKMQPFIPVGIAAGALAAAMGAAQIGTIASTQFGGESARGGGSLSGVPSLAGAGPQGAPQDIDIPEIQQNAGRELTVRLEVVGTGDELTRVLVENISVHVEETDATVLPVGSRNALDLMDS